MNPSQQSQFVSSSSNLGTSNQLGANPTDIRYQPGPTASAVSVSSSGHAERIMHHPASMKPVTGVAVSKPISTTVVHSSMHMGSRDAQGVTSSVQSVRPMSPQEVSTVYSTSSLGPRENAMIQEMTDVVASLKIPLTPPQIQEISKMTALRMEGLLGDHSSVYHDDVFATQLTFLKFIAGKLGEFGFSDLIFKLRDHILQVFSFRKDLVTEITTTNKMPTSIKLMSPRARNSTFGSRLDAYCLADLLREAAVLHTAEEICQYLRGTTTDNNMVLFIACIERAIERIGFNQEANKPALYNFVYNRPGLKTTSVSSLHSSGSLQGSVRMRRGASPTSPHSGKEEPRSQVGMSSNYTSGRLGESPQILEVRSPTVPAVVYVPETLPGNSYSSAHVKTYSQTGSQAFQPPSGSQTFQSQTFSSQTFPTTVTVKVRTTEVTPPKEEATLIGMATDMLNSRPSSTVSQTLASRRTTPEQDSVETGPVTSTVEVQDKRMKIDDAPTADKTSPVDVSRTSSAAVSQSGVGTVGMSHGFQTDAVATSEFTAVTESRMATTNTVESRSISQHEQVAVPIQPSTILARSGSHSSTGSMQQQVTALRKLATSTTRYEAPRTNVADLDSSLKHSMANLIETLNGVIAEIDDMKKHTAFRLDDVTHNLGEFAQQVHKRIDSLSAKHNRFVDLSSQLNNNISTLHSHSQTHANVINEVTSTVKGLQTSHRNLDQRYSDIEQLHREILSRVDQVSAKLQELDHAFPQLHTRIDESNGSLRKELEERIKQMVHENSQMSMTMRREIEERLDRAGKEDSQLWQQELQSRIDELKRDNTQMSVQLRQEISTRSQPDIEDLRHQLRGDWESILRREVDGDRRAMRVYEEDLTRFRGQLDELKALLNGFNFKQWLTEAETVRNEINAVRVDMNNFEGRFDTRFSEHENKFTHQMSALERRVGERIQVEPREPAGLEELKRGLHECSSRLQRLEMRPAPQHDQDIGYLRQELAEIDRRVRGVESTRRPSGPDLVQIQQQLTHCDRRIHELTQGIGPVREVVSLFEPRINAYEERLKNLETSHAQPQAMPSHDIAAIRSDMTMHEQRLRKLESAYPQAMHHPDIAALRADLMKCDQRVQRLEATHSQTQHHPDIAALRADMAMHEQRLQKLENAHPQVQHHPDIAALRSDLTIHEQRLQKLESSHPQTLQLPDIAAIRSDMSVYEQRLHNLENSHPQVQQHPDIASLKADLMKYEQRLQRLETTRAEVHPAPPSDLGNIHAHLEKHEQRLHNLETTHAEHAPVPQPDFAGIIAKVSGHEGRFHDQEKTIHDHKERLHRLETTGTVPAFVLNDIRTLHQHVKELQEGHPSRIPREEIIRIVSEHLETILSDGSPTFLRLANALNSRRPAGPVDAALETQLKAEIASLKWEMSRFKSSQSATTTMQPTSVPMHMSSDKIVINSNSPTNIYLNAEHADVTPAYRESYTSANRFGPPVATMRAALVESTPAKRPGSGSSKHKKSSQKGSPPMVGSSGHWLTSPTDTPQGATYSFATAPGGVQAVTTTTTHTTSSSTHGGATYMERTGTTPVMATSPLHVMATGGPMMVTTSQNLTGGTSLPAGSLSAGGHGTASSHGTSTTTTVPQTSEVVTLQGSPMQAIYTRGADTGTTYTVDRSHMSSVAEHSVVTPGGVEGSPLAKLSREKETEQAMLKRLEAHYKAI